MKEADQKTLAYYSMCAYASHSKKAMPIDDFFKVNEIAKRNKPMLKFLQNLKDKNRPMIGKG